MVSTPAPFPYPELKATLTEREAELAKVKKELKELEQYKVKGD